jgi:hypothetical protein
MFLKRSSLFMQGGGGIREGERDQDFLYEFRSACNPIG